MTKRLYRISQILLAFITLLVLGSAYYLQYVDGLMPCPLCIMQRLCAFIFGMLSMIGIGLFTVKRARFLAVLQLGIALGGLFFATRQLWLEFSPVENAGACLPGFDIMLKYFPWQDILHGLLWGSGDCAAVTWTWHGLPMPAFSAMYFMAMTLISGAVFLFLGKAEHKNTESK